MSSLTQGLVPRPGLDLGDTYGVLFIGAILSALLFGLTNVQAFIYFQTHTSGRVTFFKLVVIWLWTLDALHLAFSVHYVYYYLVIDYANVIALTEIVWSFKLQALLNVFIVSGIHLLYSHRIWTSMSSSINGFAMTHMMNLVSKDRARPFLMIVGIASVAGLGVGIATVFIVYQYSSFVDLAETKWLIFMALGTAAALDALIASSLCYLLATSRPGFRRTDSVITKFSHYAIDTGCLTCICSLAAVATYTFMPYSFIFLCIEFIVAKLYVNSYIALLNARYYMQSNADTIDSSDFQICHGESIGTRHTASPDEKLLAYRKSVVSRHVEGEVEQVLPTRPVRAARLPRQSILVTVERESFLD
ncbi:uncharacterized protein EDB91DRAFT_1350272 [Suillus paluster]|uniref:uncharacterized protein n=1 Tax=Suillus paluster TaxID=48578 RepID=UPI001B883F02|nr:uncharacterized protein EDB91DRAFT_1350272 [Suillus paluster]KAG1727666.1 hypothetical protein EDB91DRAFT_1350272 [Suillus paluster]